MRMSLGTLMRFIVGVAVSLALLQFVLPATGLIGFGYLVVVPNQPLRHPVRVAAVEGGRLKLADGRVFDLGEFNMPEFLEESIAESNGLVDVETDDQGQNTIWVSYEPTRCGVGFAQPIQIPLIPVRRGRNARTVLGVARPVPAEAPEATKPRP